jgi:hypothetical protein
MRCDKKDGQNEIERKGRTRESVNVEEGLGTTSFGLHSDLETPTKPTRYEAIERYSTGSRPTIFIEKPLTTRGSGTHILDQKYWIQ